MPEKDNSNILDEEDSYFGNNDDGGNGTITESIDTSENSGIIIR